jgi:hypothetical protein
MAADHDEAQRVHNVAIWTHDPGGCILAAAPVLAQPETLREASFGAQWKE